MDEKQFETIIVKLDKIVDLLALNMVRDCEKQKDKIVALSSFGYGQSEIARLLNTTPGTVNQALVRSRKEKNFKQEKSPNETIEEKIDSGDMTK